MTDGRKKTNEELSAYLDGQLPEDDRRRLDAALAESPELRAELAALEAARSLLKRLPREQAPPGLLDAILQEAERERLLHVSHEGKPHRHFWWMRHIASAAVILLTAVLGIHLYSVVHRDEPQIGNAIPNNLARDLPSDDPTDRPALAAKTSDSEIPVNADRPAAAPEQPSQDAVASEAGPMPLAARQPIIADDDPAEPAAEIDNLPDQPGQSAAEHTVTLTAADPAELIRQVHLLVNTHHARPEMDHPAPQPPATLTARLRGGTRAAAAAPQTEPNEIIVYVPAADAPQLIADLQRLAASPAIPSTDDYIDVQSLPPSASQPSLSFRVSGGSTSEPSAEAVSDLAVTEMQYPASASRPATQPTSRLADADSVAIAAPISVADNVADSATAALPAGPTSIATTTPADSTTTSPAADNKMTRLVIVIVEEDADVQATSQPDSPALQIPHTQPVQPQTDVAPPVAPLLPQNPSAPEINIPSTQPSSQPTTQPTSQPSTQPSTQP